MENGLVNCGMETLRRILLSFIVLISSAAGEMKNLTGSEGGNITLPDPVVEVGFLIYGVNTLAMVDKREMSTFDDFYKNKLLWNKNTGLFTITHLQRNDSGIYTTDSKKGRTGIISYRLTVYECVAAPAVNTTDVSSESCILLCFVDTAEDTTLLWYKDEQVVNQSSSALSLPLTVHKWDFNSSYRCVAASPAEKKSVSVNITTYCEENTMQEQRHRNNIILIMVPIVTTAVVLLIALIMKQKYFHKYKRTPRQAQGPETTETDVEYSHVRIYENRRSQQVEDLTASPGTADGSHLKTVYDKLEVHRMVSDYTDLANNI